MAWLVVVAVRWIMILVRHGDVSHLMHVAFKRAGLRAGLFYAVFAPWTRLQVRVAIAWASLEMPYSKLFVHTLTNTGLSVHKTDQALTEQERNQCVHNLVVLSCASAPAFVPAASRPQASAQSSVSVEAQKMIVPSGLSCAAPLAVSGRDHQAVALVQPSTAKAALHPFRRPVPLANRQVQPVSSCRFSIQKHNANACWHGVRRRFLQSVGSSDLQHFFRNGVDFLVVFLFDVLPVGVH